MCGSFSVRHLCPLVCGKGVNEYAWPTHDKTKHRLSLWKAERRQSRVSAPPPALTHIHHHQRKHRHTRVHANTKANTDPSLEPHSSTCAHQSGESVGRRPLHHCPEGAPVGREEGARDPRGVWGVWVTHTSTVGHSFPVPRCAVTVAHSIHICLIFTAFDRPGSRLLRVDRNGGGMRLLWWRAPGLPTVGRR